MENVNEYLNFKCTNKDRYVENNINLSQLDATDEKIYFHVCEDVDLIFKVFNIPQNKCGYLYWRDAAFLYIMSNDLKPSICNEIYPLIAKKFGKTKAAIDRAMNRCLENVLYHISKKGDSFLFTYFKNSLLYPKNGEILAMIVEVISSSKFQNSKMNLLI